VLLLPCVSVVHAQEQSSDLVLSRTVPLGVLDNQRGRAQPDVLVLMGLDGAVQDNIATHTNTGRNVITNGSFANSSGLSTAIMNSGNNVLIQNATILMLDVR
jgi:hypothetical protein